MHSHRRPRGRIFFEAVCALSVGVSFVGAWIQTGAWAFIGPAFVFTLFGLYWAIEMFGQETPAVAIRPAVAPAPEPAPVRHAEPEVMAEPEFAVLPPIAAEPEIRFERFEAPAEAVPDPSFDRAEEPEANTDVAPFASVPEPVAKAEAKPRARKSRAKKAAEPVVETPALAEEQGFDHHIEQLFDPQPFARQARPAFGKRPRGPGPRPLPAA